MDKMNRTKIYSNGYLKRARNCMKVYEYIKFMNNAYLELAEYCDHLEKALDKAIELIDKNMLCEKCPFPHNAERCTVEGCKGYLKDCLINAVKN